MIIFLFCFVKLSIVNLKYCKKLFYLRKTYLKSTYFDFIWRVSIFLNFSGYLIWRITEKDKKNIILNILLTLI